MNASVNAFRLPKLLLAIMLAAPALLAQNIGVPAPASPEFDQLLRGPASQSAFTFDRTMLSVADNFLGSNDADTKRIVAGLNSITVRNYHARDYASYDSGAFSAMDDHFRATGWKHLVNASAKSNGMSTDLWLHFSGANITNVTVLTRGDRNMSVVAVDCTLRPLDLVHLSGHLGIPKVDENAVMVPAR